MAYPYSIIVIIFPKHIEILILGSNRFLVLSLCKHMDELTMPLIFMGVSIGVMSLSLTVEVATKVKSLRWYSFYILYE